MEKDLMVWVEKYRPRTVNDCILSKSIKKQFLSFVESGDFPNLLLTGTAGTGKTTIARALCEELDYEYIVINASDERNIDVVRNKIKDFASQGSFEDKEKAIILDEADGLAPLAQSALRNAMEEFHFVKFILTANFVNRLIGPIQSRTSIISFNVPRQFKQEIALSFIGRIFDILTTEGITFDRKVVASVVNAYYPDNRRILNELQRYSKGTGAVDEGMLAVIDTCNTTQLIESIKDKNVTKLRQWAADNADTDQAYVYDEIYRSLYEVLKPESIPQMVQDMAMYLDWSTRSTNQEITLNGLLMNLLGNVEFK